jgi:hypothetical protein
MPYMTYNQTPPPPQDENPSPAAAPSQAAGNTQANAAARSASHHKRMNPRCDPNVLVHPLARMLPIHDWQGQVYRMAEHYPPGFEDGFTPIWECATALLPSLKTTQLRVNFQNQFHLVGLTGNSTVAGGFRVQIYDTKKVYSSWLRDKMGRNIGPGAPPDKPGVRLAARGVQQATFLGAGFNPANPTAQQSSAFYLREPHPFTEQDAQALVIIQNQDNSGVTANIQVVLYGLARRFNWPD